MHPSVLAYLAMQRQTELLQAAETRRLRMRSARRQTRTNNHGGVAHGPSTWGQTLMAKFRSAPAPCCA